MIRGIHGLMYTHDAEALRAFFRDKLKLPYTDAGEGWLIFDLPQGDIGFHPTNGSPPPGTHDISFYTDDIEGTVRELKANGVVFEGEIEDHGFGLVTHFLVPGGFKIMLYQPKYQKRTSSRGATKKKAAGSRSARTAKRKPAAGKASGGRRAAAKRRSGAKKAATRKAARRR